MHRWALAIAAVTFGCGSAGTKASSPAVVQAPGCPSADRVAAATWATLGSWTGWELLMEPDGAPQWTVPNGPAWFVTPGAPPCRATIGGSTWDGSGPPPRTLGRKIEGCPARPDPASGAFVLFTDAAPAGCRLEVSRAPGCSPVAIEGGHPLMKVASFADARGTAVVIAAGPGTYATYDVDGGKLVRGRKVVWMTVPEEAWTMNSGSDCL